jgi:3-phenylpropionate/cinnamic acid dioxygenase small subunit
MADSARAIEDLLYLYAERIDAGDLPGVADLFARGRIRPTPDAPAETTAAGREQVLRLYQKATRLYEDGTPRTRHLTSNAVIDVDEHAGTATARSTYTVFQQTGALPLQPIISGRYEDTFQRIDGRWWFDTRVIRVDLVGDLSHHLLFALPRPPGDLE